MPQKWESCAYEWLSFYAILDLKLIILLLYKYSFQEVTLINTVNKCKFTKYKSLVIRRLINEVKLEVIWKQSRDKIQIKDSKDISS